MSPATCPTTFCLQGITEFSTGNQIGYLSMKPQPTATIHDRPSRLDISTRIYIRATQVIYRAILEKSVPYDQACPLARKKIMPFALLDCQDRVSGQPTP